MRGGHEVVIADNRPEMITSHAMDLEQVLEQSPGCSMRGGDLGDLADADIVVLLSATPLTVGTSRLEYLGKNAAIADEFADALPGRLGRRDPRRDEPRRPARDAHAARAPASIAAASSATR